MKKQMSQRSKRWPRHLLLAALVALVILSPQLARPTLANPDTLFDTFSTAQIVTQPGFGTNWDNYVSDAANILGTERDVVVHVAAGSGSPDGRVRLRGEGYLAHSQQSGVTGYTLVTYDGEDNSDTLDYVGLGSQDLTVGGDNAFVIDLISSDLGVPLVITVYSSASACSSLTRALPALTVGDLPMSVAFPFGDFTTGAGCSSAASFADVGAFTMLIDGTGMADVDVTIDLLRTTQVDYGDLPEGDTAAPADYAMTTIANNGAGHVIGSLYLGASVDAEADGQPDPTILEANEDDLDGNDDEDGVAPTPGFNWTPGGNGSVDVTVTGGDGCLSAWIDFSYTVGPGNNSFDDAGENVLDNVAVTPGMTTHTFSVPSTVAFDPDGRSFYARFRLFPRDGDNTCTTAKSYDGQHDNGEVEDDWWDFDPTAITLSSASAQTAQANSTAFALVAIGLLGIGTVGAVTLSRRRTR